MEEPQLAADIVNYISEFLVTYIGNELTLKSTKHKIFLEGRLVKAKDKIKDAKDTFIQFKKTPPIIKDTPELIIKNDQLVMNLEVENQLYLMLREQYEKALYDEEIEKPVLDLLDEGTAMPYPYWPKHLLIYLISLFAGFMISVITISSKEILSKKT